MCRGVGEVRVEVHTSKIEVGKREILKRAILMQGVFCIVNKCFAAHAFVYLSIPIVLSR